MEKKKKNIVTSTLAVGLSFTCVASYIIDSCYVNHIKGECLFNGLLGSNHQVNQINGQYKDTDICARKVKLVTTKKVFRYKEPMITYNSDGKQVIHIPMGYDYYDRSLDKCVKEEYLKEPLLDKWGNEEKKEYILVGDEDLVNQEYYYDYECMMNDELSLIKVR